MTQSSPGRQAVRYKYILLMFYTARCYISAVYAYAIALCPSVRPSVCHSQAGATKMAKPVVTQTTPYASQGPCVLTPKISLKF